VAQHALAFKKAEACGLKAGPHAWAIIFFFFFKCRPLFLKKKKKEKK